MNAEIVARLEFSFHAEAEPKAAIKEMTNAKVLREAREEYADFKRLLERVEDELRRIREDRE